MTIRKMICAAATVACLSTLPAAAEGPATIRAVGTWGNLTNFQKHEGPFWNAAIAEATGGAIIGEIKPQTELGLTGFEIMRLVKLGVFDYAHGLPGYVAAEDAVFEGADLSALTQDIATQRQVAEAYFPVLEQALRGDLQRQAAAALPVPQPDPCGAGTSCPAWPIWRAARSGSTRPPWAISSRGPAAPR